MPFPSELSVINLVKPEFPPTVIIQATADQVIPPHHSSDLYQRCLDNGVEVKLLLANEMWHGAAETPQSKWPVGCRWWEDVMIPALQWIMAKCI